MPSATLPSPANFRWHWTWTPEGDTLTPAAQRWRVCPFAAPPLGRLMDRLWPVAYASSMHFTISDAPLRWKKAADMDACAGVSVSARMTGAHAPTLAACPTACFFLSWPFSRYRHALIRECPPERCHPSSLVPEVLNSCFEVLLLPLRPFPPLVHAGCLLVVLFLPDAVCLFVRSASWLAPPPPAKGEQMPGWIPCAT